MKELQSMGIQPDILILRTEHHLEDSILSKVAAFCNVELECVVQSEDMPSIYEVPVNMQRQGLDIAILRKLEAPLVAPQGQGLLTERGDEEGTVPGLLSWYHFLHLQQEAKTETHLGMVGKYDLQDAYKSIRESLSLAAIYNGRKAKLHFINSEDVNQENVATLLDGMNGIVICPGFGQRGIEGKIVAAEYARTHDIPTFGICLGMQMMVIEFARNELGYKDANSSEMDAKTPHNVIDMMEEQKTIKQMGGTMRLGAYECAVKKESRAGEAYNCSTTSYGEEKIVFHDVEDRGESLLVKERHRHRYEFNNKYLQEFEDAGMKCVGINPAANLVEIIEIPALKWYIGTQFHPEYSSTVLHPHPLFMSFIKACL